jgi:hypothetical protein
MFGFLKMLADNKRRGSLADRLRNERFVLFLKMTDSLPRPLSIIDVGGTELFWERMGFTGQKGIEITLLNLELASVKNEGFKSVCGDARNMKQFADKEFDIAFSNSVIEHVGDFNDQASMASEMKRVAKKIFLQTPNRYFPIEPHFLFPFFQFLPIHIKLLLVMRFDLGWYKKTTNRQKAIEVCRSIRLLTKKELNILFSGSTIHKEKFFGLTKSYILLK